MARFLHFFDSLEEKRRLSHIKNLIALAAADGHVDDCEVDFIAEVGARMGIKDEEVKRIFKHPESEDEKLVLLYDYVVVMMADKIIDDNELTFCYDTVEKLGFRRDVAPEIISEIMTSIGKERDMDGTLLSVALILHK